MEIDPVKRGQRAEQLLNEELLTETLDILEKVYLASLRHGKTLEDRETAHKYLEILDRFKGHLRSVVAQGSMTARQLDELEGRRKFWRT